MARPGHARTYPAVDKRKAIQQGQNQYGVYADWGVLDRGTIAPPGEYD